MLNLTHITQQIKYDQQHFEDNGPKIINKHGDWGVFIAGEQIDGPYFSRQDAMDAYALVISEQAEAEQTFASGPEWFEDDDPIVATIEARDFYAHQHTSGKVSYNDKVVA